MESQNPKPSVVDSYLNSHNNESQKEVFLDQTVKAPAPLLQRIVALLIDRLILFVLSLLSVMVLTSFLTSKFTPMIASLLVEFLYSGYFYSTLRATPGKLAFGLEVVAEGDRKLGFASGGLRDSIGRSISLLVLGFGFLMAFFRTDRRSLHDLIFNTRVIRR